MKSFFSLLATVVLFTACEKKPEHVPDPAPEAAFTRTVVYTNQNNSQNKVSYSGNATVNARAGIDGEQFYVGMSVMPLLPGTSGDGIWFKLDKNVLQQGLVNTYNVDGLTAPIVPYTRYVHMVERPEGGFWSSIHETSMGLKMEGTLTITDYNADRKLLSGYFNVVIKDLIHDPLQYNRVSTVDPINLNTTTITGTFSNLKIESE